MNTFETTTTTAGCLSLPELRATAPEVEVDRIAVHPHEERWTTNVKIELHGSAGETVSITLPLDDARRLAELLLQTVNERRGER